MSVLSESRPALRLVEGVGEEAVEWSWFCGNCASSPPAGKPPAPMARVCHSCGMGLLLETRRDVAPSPEDAFLVVDGSLLIQAMSRQAQSLLGLSEADAVNSPIADLLVPADAEAQGPTGFAARLADAAAGVDEAASTFIRPQNTFGVRIRARIAPCGPPRAALVVLEDSGAPRLHVVD